MAERAQADAGLWGSENLLVGTKINSDDIVTIVLAQPQARCQRADAGACGSAPSEAPCPRQNARTCGAVRQVATLDEFAARVVKVLPNGNICLESRICIGEGSLLIAGEAARADVSAERTVRIARLANLAIVARGIESDALEGLLRAAPEARVARAEVPAHREPAKGKHE